MKSKIIKVTLLCSFIIMMGCDKFLNIEPESSLLKSEFWQSEEDAESSVIACYDKIQESLNNIFIWSTLRSDLVEATNTANGNNRSFNEHNIGPTDKITNWNVIYSAMNSVNTCIEYIPTAKENDDRFSQQSFDSYMGEAYALRALLYFQLIRNYKEIPLILFPYDHDGREYIVEPSGQEVVYASIMDDLITARELYKDQWNDIEYFKGRISEAAINAMIADVALWMNNYQVAYDACDLIINSGKYELLEEEDWFKNFMPGNSKENIFELQYSDRHDEYNGMFAWFSGYESNSETGAISYDPEYIPRKNSEQDVWIPWQKSRTGETEDIRANGASILYESDESQGSSNDAIIWKWAGTNFFDIEEDFSRNEVSVPNWIFYRLADVILMKAEAANRLNLVAEAVENINLIRQRASSNELKISDLEDVNETELLILDERAKELAFEGKRWFDLRRIALRQNDINLVSQTIADAFYRKDTDKAILKGKLSDPDGWFLPIFNDELTRNTKLEQNPYYN